MLQIVKGCACRLVRLNGNQNKFVKVIQDFLDYEEFQQIEKETAVKMSDYQASLREKAKQKEIKNSEISSIKTLKLNDVLNKYVKAVDSIDNDVISAIICDCINRIPKMTHKEFILAIEFISAYNPKILIQIDNMRKEENGKYYEKIINNKHKKLLINNSTEENIDGTINYVKGGITLFKELINHKKEVYDYVEGKRPEEILHEYVNFYENCERRIKVDFLNNVVYSSKDAIKAIECFTSVGEGSDELFKLLGYWIAITTNDTPSLISFIQHFPHQIWNEQNWKPYQTNLSALYNKCMAIAIGENLKDIDSFNKFTSQHVD